MARALALAKRGLYTTDPNPRVGCVLVQNDKVVGEGWHERAGAPHAEVHALKQAGAAARGATAYVSLEPCCHQGRTPPCTQALIQARVARVLVAMHDPNPQVAGQGLAELERAGIAVDSGLLRAEAEHLNPGFSLRMTHTRPYVRVKLAASLDGRTALADGTSKWITGSPARADVQRLRARSSAILTGIGTVLADDPALTVRELDIGRQPLRVVVDRRLQMPPTAQMLRLPGKTLVVTTSGDPLAAQSLRSAGAELLQANGAQDTIDLAWLLQQLALRESNEVLVEAGATLSGALLKAGLVDELIVYLAPHLMGNNARALFNFGIEAMHDRIDIEIQDMRALGKDWRVTAMVKNSL